MGGINHINMRGLFFVVPILLPFAIPESPEDPTSPSLPAQISPAQI